MTPDAHERLREAAKFFLDEELTLNGRLTIEEAQEVLREALAAVDALPVAAVPQAGAAVVDGAEILDRIWHDIEHAESGRAMARQFGDHKAVERFNGRIEALSQVLRETGHDAKGPA